MRSFLIIIGMASSLLFSQWSELKISPFNGKINGFYLTDSLNITAVFSGDSCYVIKSSDGGRNWYISKNIPKTEILKVEFVDELNIFLLNKQHPLLKTSNGGETWNFITIPSRYQYPHSFQVFSPDTIYVAAPINNSSTYKTHMLKSYDGGNNWAAMDTSVTLIYSFKFFSTTSGWVFGGYIYRTTDGGNTLNPVPIPVDMQNPESIDILNENTLVIAGSRYQQIFPGQYYPKPIMSFSSNGGASWLTQDLGFNYISGYALNVRLLNESTAIALLSMPSDKGIIYTTNKGVNWNYGNSAVKDFRYDDIKILDNRIYLAGSGASFLVSGNSSLTQWDVRMDQTFIKLKCAGFLDPGYAIVGDEGGNLQVSTDRGNTWLKKKMPTGKLNKIHMVNDSLVYLLDSNKIYRSKDLCNTIEYVTSRPAGVISDIQITGDGSIWVCSGSYIFQTDHTGQFWNTRLTALGDSFQWIKLFEDGTGYTSNRNLYKTTDHGNTWNLIGAYYFFISQIVFYDSNNGFIVGNNGKVFRTNDGGITFLPVEIPGMSNAFRIFCKDSLNFYLSANKLYSTYDGGEMWKENEFINISNIPAFSWMTMYDHFEGIGVSLTSNTTAWKTHNRGNTPVELSLFSALPFGNKVVLQWTTETETNNMGFEIERRDKYGDWKKIAFSKGSGTSTRKIFYGYDDYEPKAPAILYYRLKQIDYNGEFEYSNEVEVLLGEIPENYSIQQNYPNPFNPSTKLTFSLPEENKVVIKVFNAMGEQVREIDRGILSHGYFEQDFEMGTESSGMYFCQVLCTNTISGRTKSLTVKMVLMK
ncbi:MAG: hypothetical protein KBF60_09110 [Ignavibacteriaceae bacterium]|nr:hypothetical protein [Ignavibacteriaceae bacterium]